MAEEDPFRQHRLGVQALRQLYTDVGSFNMYIVGTAPRICEGVQRTVYTLATSEAFPKDAFHPWHEPKTLLMRMGTFPFYSPKLQAFFTRGQGRALADVEYGGTPFEEYVKPRNRTLAGELVNGIELYLDETVQLIATNSAFLAAVVASKPKP